MGLVQSSFAALSPETFSKSLRAHKLHLALRHWSDVKVWSAFRRVRKLSRAGQETLSLSETSEVLCLDDVHLLFLWDFASPDDQSVDLRFLLTTVCLFSGCPLNEKGRFLLCLFDRSYRGVITCHELTQIAYTVNLILHKCCPAVDSTAAIKDTILSVRRALPILIPSLADVVQDEDAFYREQVVTAADINNLLNDAIKPHYVSLPCAETKFALRQKRGTLLHQTTSSPTNSLTVAPEQPTQQDSSNPPLQPPSTTWTTPTIHFTQQAALFSRDTEVTLLREQINRANSLIAALQADLASVKNQHSTNARP